MPQTLPTETLATLAEVGKDLYQLGLVTSHGGNLSMRVPGGMWITGTGTMLGRLRDRHISFVHTAGHHEGTSPSSDTLLHSTIYAVTGASAIVHAHPRHATALPSTSISSSRPTSKGSSTSRTSPSSDPGHSSWSASPGHFNRGSFAYFAATAPTPAARRCGKRCTGSPHSKRAPISR
ncbi:MAG: class II aldolase/adducin family protein [Dehalococcoidia bacterium]